MKRDWRISRLRRMATCLVVFLIVYVATSPICVYAAYTETVFGRVVDEDTDAPIEDAFAIVMGKGIVELTRTSVGGWFNIEENSQAPGSYMIVVLKLGYQMAVQFIDYQHKPLEETVKVRKW